MIALDKETGTEVWRGGDEQISYASPALMDFQGVPQIVSVNEASVTGHDLRTGDVLWRHSFPGRSNMNASGSQPVYIDAERMVISKGYGGNGQL